jgi:uncharacterized membrane protein (Fun14 family)
MRIVKTFGSATATTGSGFFVGILIGYALKEVIKIAAVMVGLFLAGVAYLQYHHQIANNINWDKLQTVSEAAITILSNVVIIRMPAFGYTSDQAVTASSLAMTSFGIPLAGSMSAGFTIGFINGSFMSTFVEIQNR